MADVRPQLDRQSQPDVEASIAELYHENSKQRRHDLDFGRRIYLVNRSAAVRRAVARSFKGYPGASVTALPSLALVGTPVEDVLRRRRSHRRFTGAPLTLDELARLLHSGNGITGHLDAPDGEVPQPVRAAPSGGALYPVELYAAVMAVDGVPAGVHHYSVARHALELVSSGDPRDALSAITGDPGVFSGAAVAFVLTTVLGRGRFKYGERAYRFALLEAGHMTQNLMLAATALDVGSVPVGGFVDDELNALLDVDGVDEAAVCLVVAGRSGAAPSALVARLLTTVAGSGPTAPSSANTSDDDRAVRGDAPPGKGADDG
jgi:SagB-type dehydrogenase family enzyme